MEEGGRGGRGGGGDGDRGRDWEREGGRRGAAAAATSGEAGMTGGDKQVRCGGGGHAEAGGRERHSGEGGTRLVQGGQRAHRQPRPPQRRRARQRAPPPARQGRAGGAMQRRHGRGGHCHHGRAEGVPLAVLVGTGWRMGGGEEGGGFSWYSWGWGGGGGCAPVRPASRGRPRQARPGLWRRGGAPRTAGGRGEGGFPSPQGGRRAWLHHPPIAAPVGCGGGAPTWAAPIHLPESEGGGGACGEWREAPATVCRKNVSALPSRGWAHPPRPRTTYPRPCLT